MRTLSLMRLPIKTTILLALILTGLSALHVSSEIEHDHPSSSNIASLAKETNGVASDDKIASDEETCTDSSPTNLKDFRRFFRRLGTSWSHVFSAYIDTVQSAHGKHLPGDLLAVKMEEALEQLRNLVHLQRQKHTSDSKAWEFRSVPLQEFDRTLDDVLVAFLRWSASDSSVVEDDDCKDGLRGGVNKKGVTPINVSNAFRRLESYAAWMEEQSDFITEPPLTWASVKHAHDLFYSKVTYDSCGRVVWWLDLGQTNFTGIQELPHKEILRLFVWLAHLLMFDEEAQRNGIVFVDSMAKISFYRYMTMLPLQSGMAIDKFMISVIPLKTKLVVFSKRPLWFDIIFGMLRMFLHKSMRQRVEIPDEGNQGLSLQRIVGSDRIPTGFDDFEGSDLVVDLIVEHEKKKMRDA